MESLWLPGLAVLLAGLGAGWWAARRLAAGGGGDARRDQELAVADLEARRDQIYAQLRGESGEPPTGADRRQLELSAARVLKELEEKRAALAPARGRRKKKRAPAAAAGGAEGAGPRDEDRVEGPPAAAGGFAARHPLVAGFALGAGMVTVVGVLIYWAVRDARPDPAAAAARTPPPAAVGGLSPDEAHGDAGELPITLRVELDALDERIAADPGDLGARRERALFNLGIERYVEAFEDANVLLASNPQDIDGLYVQGVVRLTMGQEDLALDLFDRVLELFPDHARALVWRGILLFRGGDRDGALASWRRALELSGGSQPEIEELIRVAEQAPPPDALPPAAAPPVAAAPVPGPAPPPAVGAQAFGVRVTLADGAFPPPGGVLFVSLRPAGGGPPIAVKRIDRVAGFPFDLILDASDSMMGQELPASGLVRVRIDADGSASTRSPDDLEAEVEARQGSTVSLVLGGP